MLEIHAHARLVQPLSVITTHRNQEAQHVLVVVTVILIAVRK